MQLGKYRLVRRIGQGGMGEVWEGELPGEGGFARRVAIKRLKAQGGETWERRFMDEAKIASRLHHANIVSVFDFGAADGEFFQVLELIDGIDARRLYELARQKGEQLPVEIALHLCVEVAHGLASAHTAKDEAGVPMHIVHRDVSLENVLISWQGDVKLSDFGVAKARDRSHETLAGATVGKPSYMAPEQATGGDVDARTDVFALGCVLHALFCGVTPLAGEDRMAELLAGKPLPIHELVPAEIAPVIAKAISRSKIERYASADEMAEALAKLRHSKISDDPRRVLSAYLTKMRPAPKKAGGALDAMLGVEPSVEHQATPVAVVAPPQPTLMYGGKDLTQKYGDQPAQLVEQQSSRAPLIGGGVLLIAAASIAAVFLWPTEKPVEVAAPKSDAPPALQTPSPSVGEGAPVLAVPTPVEQAKVEPAPPPPQPKAKPRPKAAPTAQGVFAIGGAKALGAEILVDGQSVGFAPKQLELTVGSHEVTLVQRDGSRIGPHKIELTERNTQSQPLRWLP
ncbi:MAG: serine/threonine-protein kinase [Myxococcaceae bacterium]